jgi:hypothetical protein
MVRSVVARGGASTPRPARTPRRQEGHEEVLVVIPAGPLRAACWAPCTNHCDSSHGRSAQRHSDRDGLQSCRRAGALLFLDLVRERGFAIPSGGSSPEDFFIGAERAYNAVSC